MGARISEPRPLDVANGSSETTEVTTAMTRDLKRISDASAMASAGGRPSFRSVSA